MKFPFYGFIQIAIGIAIDYLTTLMGGTARVFIRKFTQITQIFWASLGFFGNARGNS